MQKFFKILSSFVLTMILLAGSTILILAWNAPSFKKEYVEEDEEFRAVWVCTVDNMDVDMQLGTSEASIKAWKERYLIILENAINAGMNAIIFQVSPCNDAFYPSKYKPWSKYLAGYGVDPGWDPVEWMIEVTHQAGLEYHAWFNPYRASTSALEYSITENDAATSISYLKDYDKDTLYSYKQSYFENLKSICKANDALVDNPVFASGDELDHNVVFGTEGKFVLNPASTTTIEHLENTIEEFVTNYDADGIHFDDYFYPNDASYRGSEHLEYKEYTFSTEPDIDLKDYNAYLTSGGDLSIYDWRRENVNTLIQNLSDIIRTKNQTRVRKCAFGISPGARYAPTVEACSATPYRGVEGGMEGGCNGYYSYSDLYADTRKWVLEGWLDYILPQNYTQLGSAAGGVPTGDYSTINKWWSDVVKKTNCKLYVGTPLYQVSSWSADGSANNLEIYYQIKWNQEKNYQVDGYVMFRYDSMLTGAGYKAMKAVTTNLWHKAALTPIYSSYTYESVKDYAKIKELKNDPSGLYTVIFEKVEGAKAYGILADDEVVARVLSGSNEISFTKEEGKTYKLVTYGFDNQIYSAFDTVDFNQVKTNQAPTVVLNTKLEKNYLIMSKIDLNFTVTDADGDLLTYTLYALHNNKKYEIANKVSLTSETIDATYECFAVEMLNMQFVLEVDDGYQKTIFESELFNVVKEIPVETVPETPPTNSETPKEEEKKCGSKCGTLMMSVLSAVSLLGVILRKKD